MDKAKVLTIWNEVSHAQTDLLKDFTPEMPDWIFGSVKKVSKLLSETQNALSLLYARIKEHEDEPLIEEMVPGE